MDFVIGRSTIISAFMKWCLHFNIRAHGGGAIKEDFVLVGVPWDAGCWRINVRAPQHSIDKLRRKIAQNPSGFVCVSLGGGVSDYLRSGDAFTILRPTCNAVRHVLRHAYTTGRVTTIYHGDRFFTIYFKASGRTYQIREHFAGGSWDRRMRESHKRPTEAATFLWATLQK